jgi:hypothetical protein
MKDTLIFCASLCDGGSSTDVGETDCKMKTKGS